MRTSLISNLSLPLLLGLWLVWPLQAAAVSDRLETPAVQSPLASHALLLDVTRAGSRLVAVGERGHVVFSDDEGKSWQQGRVPVSVTLTAVSFADPRHGWAVGHDGVILFSADGGESWEKQLDGNGANRLLVDYLDERLAAVEAGSAEGDPDELGMMLEEAQFAAEEGPASPFLDVWFRDSRYGWAVGAYGLFFATRDGGQSWQPMVDRLDNPDRFHLNSIVGSGERLLIAGEAGVLFESRDGGESWERLESGYDGPLFGALLEPDDAWAVALRGRLFHRAGGDEEWRETEAETRATLNSLLRLKDGSLLALGNGGVLLYQAAGSERFGVFSHPDRQSYLAGVELAGGELLLVGQKGVHRLTLDQIRGALHE